MATIAQPRVTVKWVQPAPQWDPKSAIATSPSLVEFSTDQFMQQFLAMMAGQQAVDLQPPKDSVQSPKDSVQPSLHDDTIKQKIAKLYQPFHQRYYLVTGSLVCRHLGLPDHTVNRKNGEKVSYVLRRVITTNGAPTEYGWVDDGNERAWKPLIPGSSLLANEERLPLHSTKVLPQPHNGTPNFQSLKAQSVATANSRTIYYGYIPVSSREKYLTPLKSDDAAQMIQDEITSLPPDQQPPDPRLDEVTYGVIMPWYQMLGNPSFSTNDTSAPITLKDASLFILLNLGNFLQKNMPDVFHALISKRPLEQTSTGETYTARQKLLTALLNVDKITIYTNTTGTGVSSTLSDALQTLKDSFQPPQDQESDPPYEYDISVASLGSANLASPLQMPQQPAPPPPRPPKFPPNLPPSPDSYSLYTLFEAALIENRVDKKLWVQVPPELQDLIKVEPDAGDVYFLRLVYEHAPCDPVVSDPSQPFVFAKFFDPDAPARHIRIELPSIKLKDLRKYKRGVGLQFSSDLHNLVGRVNSGMLSGGGLLPTTADANSGIAFICSFSIVIVFMVALIVMFIFLILFNIIFWWLPFVRICFPIPTRKSSGT